MVDTSPLPSNITPDVRVSVYTDRLVDHIAEQAGSKTADAVRDEITYIRELIAEGDDAVLEIDLLGSYLTRVLGLVHVITVHLGTALTNIFDAAREGTPDDTRSASYDPYGHDTDVRGFITRHAE